MKTHGLTICAIQEIKDHLDTQKEFINYKYINKSYIPDKKILDREYNKKLLAFIALKQQLQKITTISTI